MGTVECPSCGRHLDVDCGTWDGTPVLEAWCGLCNQVGTFLMDVPERLGEAMTWEAKEPVDLLAALQEAIRKNRKEQS